MVQKWEKGSFLYIFQAMKETNHLKMMMQIQTMIRMNKQIHRMVILEEEI